MTRTETSPAGVSDNKRQAGVVLQGRGLGLRNVQNVSRECLGGGVRRSQDKKD